LLIDEDRFGHPVRTWWRATLRWTDDAREQAGKLYRALDLRSAVDPDSKATVLFSLLAEWYV